MRPPVRSRSAALREYEVCALVLHVRAGGPGAGRWPRCPILSIPWDFNQHDLLATRALVALGPSFSVLRPLLITRDLQV